MFKFTNFVTPGTIYHGTVTGFKKSCEAGEEGAATTAAGAAAGGEEDGPTVSLKVFRETKVPGICADDYETKQVGRKLCRAVVYEKCETTVADGKSVFVLSPREELVGGGAGAGRARAGGRWEGVCRIVSVCGFSSGADLL